MCILKSAVKYDIELMQVTSGLKIKQVQKSDELRKLEIAVTVHYGMSFNISLTAYLNFANYVQHEGEAKSSFGKMHRDVTNKISPLKNFVKCHV